MIAGASDHRVGDQTIAGYCLQVTARDKVDNRTNETIWPAWRSGFDVGTTYSTAGGGKPCRRTFVRASYSTFTTPQNVFRCAIHTSRDLHSYC